MATELRKRGVSMDEIAGMMGHRTGGITEIYAHYAPDFRGDAARAIDAYFVKLFGDFAAVAPKRGLRHDAKSLENLVGERGFEPPAPTSRT